MTDDRRASGLTLLKPYHEVEWALLVMGIASIRKIWLRNNSEVDSRRTPFSHRTVSADNEMPHSTRRRILIK